MVVETETDILRVIVAGIRTTMTTTHELTRSAYLAHISPIFQTSVGDMYLKIQPKRVRLEFILFQLLETKTASSGSSREGWVLIWYPQRPRLDKDHWALD
jgi:hypothetical protein